MSGPPSDGATARCTCGRVELAARGAPILGVVCYCDDCQEGARRIEALPGAPAVRDPDGGTAYLLYRKDRVRCAHGAEHLRAYKIKETSATNRMVATCCNTAMFVGFDRGPHWVSAYRARFQGDVPPLQMRINTRFKPAHADIPGDVPSYARIPLSFAAKLVAARIAMMFGR